MRLATIFILNCWAVLLFGIGSSAVVVINEVNAVEPSISVEKEFVELYNPEAKEITFTNAFLVLYGSDNRAYASVDLSGKKMGAEAFLVVGSTSSGDLSVVNASFSEAIQNVGAVALYSCSSPCDFPDGTEVTNIDLVDAVVHDNLDRSHDILTGILTPGFPALLEDTSFVGGGGDESIGRCDGESQPRNMSQFRIGFLTPGEENQCSSGGEVAAFTPTVPPSSPVIINEVNSESLALNGEYVELLNAGDSDIDLADHVLVFYEGTNNMASDVVPLNGTLLAGGFYVVGKSGVSPTPDRVIDEVDFGSDGARAVALYQGEVSILLAILDVTNADLVDALVFSSDGSTANILAGLLTPGFNVIHENASFSQADESLSRCLGDAPRTPTLFILARTTPFGANGCQTITTNEPTSPRVSKTSTATQEQTTEPKTKGSTSMTATRSGEMTSSTTERNFTTQKLTSRASTEERVDETTESVIDQTTKKTRLPTPIDTATSEVEEPTTFDDQSSTSTRSFSPDKSTSTQTVTSEEKTREETDEPSPTLRDTTKDDKKTMTENGGGSQTVTSEEKTTEETDEPSSTLRDTTKDDKKTMTENGGDSLTTPPPLDTTKLIEESTSDTSTVSTHLITNSTAELQSSSSKEAMKGKEQTAGPRRKGRRRFRHKYKKKKFIKKSDNSDQTNQKEKAAIARKCQKILFVNYNFVTHGEYMNIALPPDTDDILASVDTFCVVTQVRLPQTCRKKFRKWLANKFQRYRGLMELFQKRGGGFSRITDVSIEIIGCNDFKARKSLKRIISTQLRQAFRKQKNADR